MNELVIGFIPLLDCAALAVAREKGFAEDEGLALTLVRETSWANIRDRVLVGHFDAAHMLGPMTVASTLGLGHLSAAMVAPFAFGFGGNAITVSTALHEALRATGHQEAGALGAAATARSSGLHLKAVIARRAAAGLPPLTFGMVYPFSCHNYELRYWLAAAGIDPDHDVQLVVIPPPFLVDAMRAGHLDGFCVGEPWNSMAVQAGAGRILLSTTAIWKRSPEKVLGCRDDWASRRSGELAALCRALYRASVWCAEAGNSADLARILAGPAYVGTSLPCIESALAGELPLSADGEACVVDDFHVPVAHAATFPWTSHALWFYSQMVRWGQASWSRSQVDLVRRTYRPDLYRQALVPLGIDVPSADAKPEEGVDGFFDGRPFDPQDLEAYVSSFSSAPLS